MNKENFSFDDVFSLMQKSFPRNEYRTYENQKKLLKNPAKYVDNDAEDWTGKLCDMYLDAKPKMLKFIQKNPKNSYEKNMAKVVKKQIIANFSDYR